VQELRNDYNLARVDQRSLEKLTSDKKQQQQQRLFKLKETTPTTTVTVVNISSGNEMTTIGGGGGGRDVVRGIEVGGQQQLSTAPAFQQRNSSSTTAVTTSLANSQYGMSGSSYLPQSSSHITRFDPLYPAISENKYGQSVSLRDFFKGLLLSFYFCIKGENYDH
jgi:hypothetical protein